MIEAQGRAALGRPPSHTGGRPPAGREHGARLAYGIVPLSLVLIEAEGTTLAFLAAAAMVAIALAVAASRRRTLITDY